MVDQNLITQKYVIFYSRFVCLLGRVRGSTIHLDFQKIFLENPQMTLFFIFANNAILQM